MPTTSVEKTSGAMIDLMRFRKMSRRKKTALPQSGRRYPSRPPTTSPTRIQPVSESLHQGRRPATALLFSSAIVKKFKVSSSRFKVCDVHQHNILSTASTLNLELGTLN